MSQPEGVPTTGDSGSLGGRIVRGSAWTAALQLSQLAIGILRLVVIARILAPADLGLFGMALLALMVGQALTETGLEQAVIQRPKVNATTLHVAWSALVVRNAFVVVCMLSASDLVAGFFGEASVAPVVRFLCLPVLLDGFTSMSILMFKKRMQFREYFVYQMSGQLAELAVSLPLAFILRNAWALVAGAIVGASVRLAVSHRIGSYRPRFVFNLAEMASLFRYGKWLTLSSVLVFVLVQGDDVFVGKMFGVALLGQYQLAYRLSNLPATGISGVLANVLLPAYASVQHDPEQLGTLYLRALRLTSALALPVSAMIFGLAHHFTLSVLGDKWLPAVPMIQVLAIYGAMRSLGATTGPVFLAVGRPEIRTQIQVGQLLLLLIVIYPLARTLGPVGVAWAVTVYALVFNAYAVFRAVRLCGRRATGALTPVMTPLMCALGSLLMVVLCRSVVDGHASVAALLGLTTVGVFSYSALMLVADRVGNGVYRQELTRAFHNLFRRSGRIT